MRFLPNACAVAAAVLFLGGAVSPSLADDQSPARSAGPGGTPTDASRPTISIFSPSDGAKFTGSQARIIYTVAVPSGLPVDSIDVLVDGKPVATRRGLERPDELA